MKSFVPQIGSQLLAEAFDFSRPGNGVHCDYALRRAQAGDLRPNLGVLHFSGKSRERCAGCSNAKCCISEGGECTQDSTHTFNWIGRGLLI